MLVKTTEYNYLLIFIYVFILYLSRVESSIKKTYFQSITYLNHPFRQEICILYLSHAVCKNIHCYLIDCLLKSVGQVPVHGLGEQEGEQGRDEAEWPEQEKGDQHRGLGVHILASKQDLNREIIIHCVPLNSLQDPDSDPT